ncbi:hypothetical protein J5N97_023647 [Dioscorea zingiberensis]|uniref:E3 ubiquitin-protein ligase RMA n=1 Tax=Dioscorea zingiberensis TaxID=325984 RepID=A0A9D5C5N2_9LILI|nr:hypothetical protein J5N97_023647 [Dioscorea zingiberensis]
MAHQGAVRALFALAGHRDRPAEFLQELNFLCYGFDLKQTSSNYCFVTLCGHLYCWPCIYKWLEIKSTDPRQCPVCKASLSRDALVPLYGRGNTSIDTKNSSQSPEIPKRPRPGYSPSDEFDIDHHHYDHHHNYQYQYYSGGSPPHWPTETSVFRSTAGGVIEGIAVSILPSMFQDRDSIYYSRPQLISENNPRLRRQEIQAERSLNQLWSFLCCSAIVFLLLF